MKQFILFIAALLVAGNMLTAKTPDAVKTKTLVKKITLKIDREGGANGAAVAWHPVLKIYYAAMAGNKSFPMILFDERGKKISGNDLETMFDVRGLWYNPVAKTLQTNGYNDFGWGEYLLDAKGMPLSVKDISATTGQPSVQSVGAYDAKKNYVYFYNAIENRIERHMLFDSSVDATQKMHLGMKNAKDAGNSDDHNENVLIYTGIPNAEIGLLNAGSKRIELYDVNTGFMTQVLKLPDSEDIEVSLNFSYCNGMFWIFDKKQREWHGYKMQ